MTGIRSAQKGVQRRLRRCHTVEGVGSSEGERMSLGVSSQLAPRTVSHSFTHALHATAFTTLAAAFLTTLTLQAEWPGAILWPAMLAIIPPAAVLALVGRSRTTFFSAAYLLVGGAAVYWFTLTLGAQLPQDDRMIATLQILPSVALLLVGGSGVGVLAGLGWATGGFVVGTVAASVARLQLQQPPRFEIITTGLYLFTALLLVLVWFTSRIERRAVPALTRATRDEVVAQMRWRIQTRSAALLHDTVLSHLAAVANAPERIGETARMKMRHDLDQVFDEAWLDAEVAPAADRSGHDDSPVVDAVSAAEAQGLDVDLTGDLDALARLDRTTQEELALAVTQCLVNVIRHSGVRDAEVSVSGDDGEVLLMIIDAGVGFVEAQVPDDRLGLRGSIRGRISGLGGTVQVWSTVGFGTSVIIRVPAPARSGGPAEQGAAAEDAPAEDALAEDAPAEQAPAERAPAERAPAERASS